MPADMEEIGKTMGDLNAKPTKQVDPDDLLFGPAHQANGNYTREGLYESGVPFDLMNAPSHVGNQQYPVSEVEEFTRKHVAPLYTPK